MLARVPIGLQHDPGALYPQGEFAIDPEVRPFHIAIFGATGAGKSTLMRNMIADDIANGLGVTLVDPHGQLAEDILSNHIKRYRVNDVIFFDPKDPVRTISLNLIDSPSPDLDDLVVSNALDIFRKLWPDAFAAGARMEDILRNSLYALIEHPSPTSLWNLPPLLTDPAYRRVILRKVKNPPVKMFFEGTFDKWAPAFREEAISAVLNKVRPFLTNPRVRAIVGPAHSSFRFRSVIDDRKILLCDLSKGAIGSDNATLLGSLIVMQEKLAALSRSDIPEEDRVPHVLYVEEAQNFVSDFESILAECRKYRLGVVPATQGVESLSPEDASAIFANAATLISFRVSSMDAQRLRQEFSTFFPADDLHELPNYKAYVRTLRDNAPSGPHRVTTYAPLAKTSRDADRATVIRVSNERWTKPRAEIEAKLARFLRREFKSAARKSTR